MKSMIGTAMGYVQERFDNMDHNNQINLLWNMVDIARAGNRYTLDQFHYGNRSLLASCIIVAPNFGAETLTKMAQTLSLKGFGTKMGLIKLMRAAA